MGEGGNTGLLKRYLLVLAGRNSSHQVDGAGSKGQHHEHSGQAKGLAATGLSELLATKTSDMNLFGLVSNTSGSNGFSLEVQVEVMESHFYKRTLFAKCYC